MPESTASGCVALADEFFVAKRKRESTDRILAKSGIDRKEGDGYYRSPYEGIAENGFVRPENLGERLSIDELNVAGDVYTIVGNPVGNRIVAFLPGTKAKPVVDAFSAAVPYSARLAVKETTLDMSESMDWIVRELFPQAKRTLDRFHVTKNVLEDVQAVRTRIKTGIKEDELSKEEACRIERKWYVPKRLGNGETRLEFVSRLRYQLFERRKDWGEGQKARWTILERREEFAELAAVYGIVDEFYRIYDSEVSRAEAKPLWEEWFRKTSRFENIRELQNAGRTVKNHLEGVLNYFGGRNTNAFAEGLHSRIRRLISNSRGFRNRDYLVYRIMKTFA